MNKIIERLKTLPKLFVILVIIIAVVGVGTSAFLYVQYQKVRITLNNPSVAAQLESQDLVKKVSRFISLPEGELPTIATVSDYQKLKEQPFFEKSQNGDKVLIYTRAKKAYLYRPPTNKVIDVAPINIGSPSASQVQTLRVALYNGTTTMGLTKSVEADLKAKFTNVEVVIKDNAKKNDYTKTLVIDLTDNKKDAAAQLAKVLGGEVTTLPKDETKPDADILVIIGK